MIRDEITGANKGQVKLTALALFGFVIIRSDQYEAVKFKTVD